MTLRSRSLVVGVLASLLVPSIAFADAAPPRAQTSAPRVVLIVRASASEAWTPAMRRVRAELQAEGFETRDHAAPTGIGLNTVTMPPWVSAALEDPAVLGVAVFLEDTTGGAALLWWDRNASGTAVARTLEVPVRNEESAEMLAVQAAELAVAASMQPSTDAPPPAPPPPDSAPPAPPSPMQPPSSPHWRVSLGFGPTGSPGGLRPMAGPSLSAGYGWGARQQLGVEANTLVTAVRSDIKDPTDRVGWALLRAHAMWWGWAHRRVSACAGVGSGAAIAWAEQAQVRTAVGLLSTTFGGSVGLSPRVAAVARAGVSWTLPGLDIRTGAASIATAGRPLLDGWIGLQFRG